MVDLFSEPDAKMTREDFDMMIDKLVSSFSLLNWIWMKGEGKTGNIFLDK